MNAWKVDRVTANHSLSSTAIQQKSQHSLSLLSLSWDVTARHKSLRRIDRRLVSFFVSHFLTIGISSKSPSLLHIHFLSLSDSISSNLYSRLLVGWLLPVETFPSDFNSWKSRLLTSCHGYNIPFFDLWDLRDYIWAFMKEKYSSNLGPTIHFLLCNGPGFLFSNVYKILTVSSFPFFC